MNQLLRFPSSVKRDPAIDHWMKEHSDELGAIACYWFEVMRKCGSDVRELLHDGHPTACVNDAAFAYVNAFKSHVNVGFFRGAEIADAAGLLEGQVSCGSAASEREVGFSSHRRAESGAGWLAGRDSGASSPPHPRGGPGHHGGVQMEQAQQPIGRARVVPRWDRLHGRGLQPAR